MRLVTWRGGGERKWVSLVVPQVLLGQPMKGFLEKVEIGYSHKTNLPLYF